MIPKGVKRNHRKTQIKTKINPDRKITPFYRIYFPSSLEEGLRGGVFVFHFSSKGRKTNNLNPHT